MKYAVVIEKAPNNYSAYVPDLPGCITTGKTIGKTMDMLREAIELHLEGMIADGEAVPQPTTECAYVEVDLAKIEDQAAGAKR